LKSATASCVGFVPTLIGDPASSANPLLSALCSSTLTVLSAKLAVTRFDAAVALKSAAATAWG